MSSKENRIKLLHPDPDKQGPNILKEKYDLVSSVILDILSADRSGSGILFKELADKVATRLSAQELENLGSVGWYTTSVKLDLEARRKIERIPKSSPQRIRIVS